MLLCPSLDVDGSLWPLGCFSARDIQVCVHLPSQSTYLSMSHHTPTNRSTCLPCPAYLIFMPHHAV